MQDFIAYIKREKEIISHADQDAYNLLRKMVSRDEFVANWYRGKVTCQD